MQPTNRKNLQTLIIVFFAALIPSGLIAQFKYDLRQQLYLPFRQHDLSKLEFDWSRHSSAQMDSNITLMGRWAWGHCYAVAAQGHYAYISNGAAFQILDVSDPAIPQLVGEITTPDLIIDIAVSDNTAYVADWNAGLRILDIANPQMPIELFQYPEREAVGIKISRNYAYLSGASGLTILDIANPAQPQKKFSGFSGAGPPSDLEVREPYLYLNVEPVGFGVFAIIDISRPEAPVFRSQFLTPDYAHAIALNGNYAYVAERRQGLHIFDISNPDTIKYVNGIGVAGVAWDIVISGNLAYVATSDGLQIFDISIPTQPQPLGYVDTPTFSLSSAVVGNYCYVADFVNMVAIDVSSATRPQIVGQFETGYFAEAAAVSGNYAYVAEGLAGLWILDVSDPIQPKAVGHFKTEGYVNDVVVSKNIAYLAKGQNGIEIVEVSEPIKPTSVVQIKNIFAEALLSHDDKLFVAAGEMGMLIFDIKLSNNPRLIGQFDTRVYAEDVDVSGSGNVAYITDASGGLFIVDISHPQSPNLLSNYAPEGFVSAVTVSDNNVVFIVYTRRIGGTFIRALNVSDPRNPVELVSFPQSVTALVKHNRFLIIGSLARIMGTIQDGVKLIDIADLTQVKEVAYYYTHASLMAFHTLGNGGGGLATDGRFICWAFGFNGLYILDVSNITSVNANPSEPKNVLLRGFKLFQNYPNPFNAETSIEYELSESGQVVMKVFNLAGNEVVTLVNAKQTKGRHRISFDASHLPSGIYVYHLKINNQTVAKKMVVAK
jgi:hypothetical protein